MRPAKAAGKVKAALIGTGQIARQHLACLRELPGVETVAVCDLSPGLAECAAERFGVARWYTSHRAMIEEARPDVVHVTTPPPSHFRLAMDALEGGAHVFVEKPATATLGELEALSSRAIAGGLTLVENYNYLFNSQVVRILELVEGGEFGEVVHADVAIHLDIKGEGSPFADPNLPHPCLAMAGGAIADFLPHLASLAHRFVGPHRSARALWSKRLPSPLPSDEFRAIVEGERGIATLSFSANSQPDAFWLRVQGARMHAAANLFETRLTVNRVRGGPKPLRPLRDNLVEAKDVRRAAFGTLWRKLGGGPASYEGLWTLLGKTYQSLADGGPAPITARQVVEVNRLIDALKPVEGQRP